MNNQNLIKIKARGGKELKKHLAAGKLTFKQAILAKCYDCMGGFVDGKVDCHIPRCPLYPLMAYREKAQNTPFLSLEYGENGTWGKKIIENQRLPQGKIPSSSEA